MRACCVACNLGQLKLSLFHMHEYSNESYLVLDLAHMQPKYACLGLCYSPCCVCAGCPPFCCSRPAFVPAMMSAVMSERGACFAASTSAPRLQRTHQAARPILCCASQEAGQPTETDTTSDNPLSRRAVMSASLASAAVMLLTDTPAYAVQGYTAGRIPGNRSALA